MSGWLVDSGTLLPSIRTLAGLFREHNGTYSLPKNVFAEWKTKLGALPRPKREPHAQHLLALAIRYAKIDATVAEPGIRQLVELAAHLTAESAPPQSVATRQTKR